MVIDDQSYFHVTWKCHNSDWLLQSEWAKKMYYNLLLRFKERYKIQIFSYCFMSNHPHITGYCEERELFSDFFRIVNSLFARAYNKRHARRGQVVMDRFKSPQIKSDADLEKVMFYVDLNPVRAGMIKHPKEYEFTSFHYYAHGKFDPLITPAPSYLEMGSSPRQRQKIYSKMVEEILKDDWKKKKPYSSIAFIGNPMWVKNKTHDLKLAQKKRRQEWQKRFDQRFNE